MTTIIVTGRIVVEITEHVGFVEHVGTRICKILITGTMAIKKDISLGITFIPKTLEIFGLISVSLVESASRNTAFDFRLRGAVWMATGVVDKLLHNPQMASSGRQM